MSELCQVLLKVLLGTFIKGKVTLPKCPQNPFSGITISNFFKRSMSEPSGRIGLLDPPPSTLKKPVHTWKLELKPCISRCIPLLVFFGITYFFHHYVSIITIIIFDILLSYSHIVLSFIILLHLVSRWCSPGQWSDKNYVMCPIHIVFCVLC